MAKKKEANKEVISVNQEGTESNTVLYDEIISDNVNIVENNYSDIIQPLAERDVLITKDIDLLKEFKDKIKELQKELEDTKEQLRNKTYRDIQLPDNVVYFNKNCFKIITHGEVRHLVVEAQKRNIAEDLNVVTFDISNPM